MFSSSYRAPQKAKAENKRIKGEGKKMTRQQLFDGFVLSGVFFLITINSSLSASGLLRLKNT